MPSLLRDLRHAVRSLRKHPGLVIVAVFALTIGIGLTTAMFSIVYSALMKGLPFPDADRIVIASENNLTRGWRRMDVSLEDYHVFAAQQRSFTALAGYYSGTVNVSGSERAERYSGSWVTANMLAVAGVRPLLGRFIRPGEDAPGGERVAVLSYAMWHDRYGADPAIVGRSIRANGMPYIVVGVMPERYAFPDNAQIWMPLQLAPVPGRRGRGQHLELVGRLNPAVSLDMANADLGGIARRLAADFKETNAGVGAAVIPFIDGDIGSRPRQLLYTMLGAVGLVLLIACANVANLLLDRAAHRTKEVGIRTALGASRGVVVRQFLAEAFVLAAAATVLGIVVAHVGVQAFNRAIASTNPPFWLDIRLYPPVLLFAIGITLVATMASGALPAIQSSRADINVILKDESRGASSLRIGRLSRAIVVFEIALSCGLLVAAGLTIKSIARLRHIDGGFLTRNIFTARVGFPATYTDTAQQRQFFENLQQHLRAIPGAHAAALMTSLPGTGGGGSSFAVEGESYARDSDYPRTSGSTVSAGYFDTFGIPLLSGRDFSSLDQPAGLPVAIVNQAFAEKFFPGRDPLGRRLRFGDSRSTAPWLTIVGVVPNTFSGDPEEPRPPMVYSPLSQTHANFLSMAVRMPADAMGVTSQVRDIVASLNGDIPIYFVYSMDEVMARQFWFVRVFGTMFMILGGIALLLAAVGLYAVMAFSVSHRTREVGIRMALGAQAADVVRLIFRQGLVQLGVGLASGLALALAASRLIEIILFQVQPRDPVILSSVAAVLLTTGMLACLVPALRATRVHPLSALHAE